ncbi:MAG: ATP-grasp domain-containing protein [Lachnospiraceae bacterium]|nr:ATP-grasp domain-containing protein [Lachnospiraceae bacterium]
MKVSVVYGGTKEERGPSEMNAKEIAAALDRRGYTTTLIDFGKDIVKTLRDAQTGAVFLCVQGKGYGDGTLQGILEHEGIPFTGSCMRAASLINDKILCKLLFDRYNIPTPRWDILGKSEYESGTYSYELRYPFVAKAPTQGGSFGIELIRNAGDVSHIGNIFEFDDPILLEEFIDGRFYTVGMYESSGRIITLPIAEGIDLTPKEPGTEENLIVFSGSCDTIRSELDEDLSEEMEKIALKVFEITGARGVGRVDFMVDRNNRPFVLEINAVPGMCRTSLIPMEAEFAGIEYDDMVEDILKAAL